MILPKDFVETAEGLVFAVVDAKQEDGRVLCFLRYRLQQGQWQKLSTDLANQLLTEHFPDYFYFSKRLQASLHAVPVTQIAVHHQPRQRLKQLLSQALSEPVERIVVAFCQLLQQKNIDLDWVGVTGSILIGAQNPASDIDLVFYRRDIFHQARKAVLELQQQGLCQPLSDDDWQDAWCRRDCELSLPEYIDAEQRKYNKVIFQQRKIDLGLVAEDAPAITPGFTKQGPVTLTVRVKEDKYAFDYPAVYRVDHPVVTQIICFTATYHGHAQKGDWVEVSGLLEVSANGEQRIIVGSSREARGQYIRRPR
jgi:predicted nucleotidyltransferase